MVDYLSGRQNAVTSESPDELNERLTAIAQCFGLAWLEQPNGNPLQTLWGRTDALATNELLNLGDAILRFIASNPAWTERQVEIIKTGDAGNRAGAIFELLGLSLFHCAGCKVSATAENNPGYDGVVHLDNDAALWVSIKNHGMSSAEQSFRTKAAALEVKFRDWLHQRRLTGIELRILGAKYPGSSDWKKLEKDVEDVVASINTPRSGTMTTASNFNILVKTVSPEYYPLSAHNLSSSFFMGTKAHQNEQANFLDNIRKGCANLARHVQNASDEVCPTLLVRLSATASALKCAEWANEYFKTYPNEPIGLVILYQPAVALDLSKGVPLITHYVIPAAGQRFQKWAANAGGEARRLPNMSVLVGGIASKPTRLVLMNGKQQIELDDWYTYQKADIYRFYRKEEQDLTCQLSNPAPGVMIHADIEIAGQSGVIQMIAPNQFDLLLLP
jgi:hypothetical protein